MRTEKADSLNAVAAAANKRADTTQTKQTVDTMRAKKSWLSRLVNARPDTTRKRLLTVSFTDVRANLKFGRTEVYPVAGYDLLTTGYIAGMTVARNAGTARVEAGGYVQGHNAGVSWARDERDVYRQLFLRGTFNLKAPAGNTDKLRRLMIEAGTFQRRDRLQAPDEGGTYIFGTYEKSVPNWDWFGKYDRDKTVLIGGYVQNRVGAAFDGTRLTAGLRANLMKPFDVVVFKAIRLQGRMGPTVNVDTYDGTTIGFEIIRNFRKFDRSPRPR